MGALWQRRAIRQMAFGLVPLLVIGVAVLVGLSVRFAHLNAPVAEATARAEGSVVRSQLGADKDEIELRWRDNRQTEHLSRLRFPRSGNVEQGAKATVHYDPNAPDNADRVFVAGDETSVSLTSILNGITLVGLILLAALVTTVVRALRRRGAEQRDATPTQLKVAHSRRGLITRTWLKLPEDTGPQWVPVYWDPAVDRIDPKKTYPVHGVAGRYPLPVAEVDGTPIWPAGRRRARDPRGDVMELAAPQQPEGSEPRKVSMRRHLRGDIAFILVAPLLGLLWAYVDESGATGFWLSTAVLAGVVFWIPSVYGSDPT